MILAERLAGPGAALACRRLGRPDIGQVSMPEVADHVTRLADRVSLPLIVDADTGCGTALNARQTVRALAPTAGDHCASLLAHGTTESFRDRMLDLAGLDDLIGTPAPLRLGRRNDA